MEIPRDLVVLVVDQEEEDEKKEANEPLFPRPPYAAFYEQGFPRPWLPFPWIAAALQNQNPGGALR